MHTELLDLNRYRLDKDLTYRELALRVDLPYRTLHTALTKPNARLYDRTLHKIRAFLEGVARRSQRRPQRRRSSSAAAGVSR